VHVVDNLSTGSRENLTERAEFHELDIRDPAIEKLGAEIQQAGTEPTLLRRQAQIAGHNDQRSLL